MLVATASLELGLDIGDVDLVCQLGSPRGIATLLQRAGRSGHAVGGVPKARLFPQSRDELVECAALLDCVRRGELDALQVLPAPLGVLAQQIVAEVATREWGEDELYALVRGQSGEQFALPDAIVLMRQVRRQPSDEGLVCLAATDPANLLGTVLPGTKVPRLAGARVLYRGGLPIATSVAGQLEMLVPLSPSEQHAVTRALALDPSLRWLEAEAAAAA